MKKQIITTIILIFSLFSIGAGVTVFNLLVTTSELHDLISLHEIEDIRQKLSYNVQKIEAYTFASPQVFADRLDEIIESALRVNSTIDECHQCHHEPPVMEEIDQAEASIALFEQQLSNLITTVSAGAWREEYKEAVGRTGKEIILRTEEMVNRAAATLQKRTSDAMRKIDRSYRVLGLTLLSTFLIALLAARFLTRAVTVPIFELLKAAQKITEGALGYRSHYQAKAEFGQLIESFNRMSTSLADKDGRIQNTLERLTQLNYLTLPLHASHSRTSILQNLGRSVNDLIEVEIQGIMMLHDTLQHFVLNCSGSLEGSSAFSATTEVPIHEVMNVYHKNKGLPIMVNEAENIGWPFGVKFEEVSLKNYLIAWLRHENELTGALIVINKKQGDFHEEDRNIFGIIANNIAVALDNTELYKSLHNQMEELQRTQQQLFEAEKLTALGTLAGGVAHDFNNILCGMIGNISLLKRGHSTDEKAYKMLDTVEKAGFRAANLTKQLLTFARRNVLAIEPVNINEVVNNVIALFENTISKLITIKLELPESLPFVQGDTTQLEQVVMNLCVNARDAMPKGGTLTIKTDLQTLDDEFCLSHPDAMPEDYIVLQVSDEGTGMSDEVLSRIFEPFFTTKEFGKGTGLGLAIAYGIIKSHNGVCDIESTPEKGTTFTIYLPVYEESFKEKMISISSGQEIRKKIMIIDDEVVITTMLKEHLQNMGCRVLVAANGEEAINTLSENMDIDLAILDINMPIMDGRDAFSSMKEIKPGLKVLVATGYGFNGAASELVESGADGYMLKPFSLEDITLKIVEVLGDIN